MSSQEKIYFYKYKPLKTVEELKHLESILQQKIWIAAPEDMNDPFEFIFKFEIDPSKTLNNMESLPRELASYNQQAKNGSQELTENEFSTMLSKPDFIEQNKKYKIPFKDIKEPHKKIGLFCLTTDPSNIPMWAYYGNEHKGYCLKFELDFTKIFDEMQLSLQHRREYLQNIMNGNEIVSFSAKHDNDLKFAFGKVTYSDIPETIDFHDAIEFIKNAANYDQMKFWFKKIFGIKYKQWSHENEYRLISNTNSKDSDNVSLDLRHYAPFLKVNDIIMGKYLPIKYKEKIKGLCLKYKINLYQADTSEHEYSMHIVKNNDL